MLLILAGVTISTLTGDNGILGKASMAKEKQDISETKDLARADILAKKTEKLGKDITESELEEILSKYGTFEDSEIEKELLDKTLTTKKGYKIKVSEIYDGDFEGVDRTAIKIKVYTGDDGIVVLPISDKADCTIDWSDGEVENYPLASTELTQNEENSVKIAQGLSLGIEHCINFYNRKIFRKKSRKCA